MSDNNQLPPRRDSSPSPVSLSNQVIVSSRHPRSNDPSRRPSLRSPSSSNSTNSRNRTTINARSSIQMEPGLQALLIAESQAAEMIATARAKRIALLEQANQESEAEINAFRTERELQYRKKFHQATQLERFQVKLDTNQRYQLEQLETTVTQKHESLIEYIIHCVIDDIHPTSNCQHVSSC